MKKTVGIMTFHSAHNYGSCLQAYALQSKIKELGCDVKIINFRSERQKEMYRPLTSRKGFKYILKNAFFLLNLSKRKKRHSIFEDFITKQYYLTDEYSSLEELKSNPPKFDFYISGSDQIWNTVPYDADMAYFLPFVNDGVKIAFAPSFGQIGNIEHKNEIAKYLSHYDFLSVREENANLLLDELIGKSAPVVCDPTLFYGQDFWGSLIDDKPIIDKDYIFFYTLFATPEMIKQVKMLSKATGLPVVISNVSNQYEVFSGFEKHIDCGPIEFLNLLKNAKYVFTSSFHCTVFSIIFNKNFYAFKGMDDKRISTLLKTVGLENRSVDESNAPELLSNCKSVDFDGVSEKLLCATKKSEEYLKMCLKGECYETV